MEVSIDAVREYCGEYLHLLSKCVELYPDSWDVDCIERKNALSQCAESKVPLVKKVKEKCHTVIVGYEKCVNENPEYPENCIEELKDLYNCSKNIQ